MSRIKVQNSPTIRRMPTYLHKLLKMRLEGKLHVSSTELAEYMNIEPIVVRKDIALTGISGQRRVGYDVNELIRYIKNYLSWQDVITATLIGAGALGTALLGYDDFAQYGLNVETVFDCDENKIGKEIRGREVYDIATLESRLRTAPPDIAIVCVSNAAAQQVVNRLVAVGIKYIWNFANVSLRVPRGVIVQREVIAGGLAMLTVKMKLSSMKQGDDPVEEE
ncbi:MAG: redox-sensing transcriptional repressor Rex [Lentisphaeria bacterium]|nr:redox-sensing transcriptional repressor Rex [Lentisphaeria bacterium]